MKVTESIKQKAKSNIKRIVLPEGDEVRTVEAASILKREALVEPVLLGDRDAIREVAESIGVSLEGIETIDPVESEKFDEYSQLLFDIRKSKGLTEEQAKELVSDVMYYGIMMVKAGDADGLVSGAVHSTGDMLRPALQVLKTAPGNKIVSSSFIMECPNESLGENGLLVYADCVVNPSPTAEELADIAIASAKTAKNLCGIQEPRVALVSFSTKGSAKHENVTKVQEATRLAHEKAPELLLDGELQFDAAVVPEVAELKAKGSPVAGRANVIIFPDIQAGNIGYKITQRVGGAECFAVLQGLAAPCNDLSRGCSVDDIVNTVVTTAVQAQQ